MLYHIMHHSLSRHPFDTMFVILCVIAGASSYTISNSTRSTSTHELNNRHRYSFIDIILETNLIDLLQSPPNSFSKASGSKVNPLQIDSKAPLASSSRYFNQPYNVCTLLSDILNARQLKLCFKHKGLIELVLPKIFKLAYEECIKITIDLRWTCKKLDSFLNKSSSLSFTREAALIRSLLNASMMYLIVKICSDHGHDSCGQDTYSGIHVSSDRSMKTHDFISPIRFNHEPDEDSILNQIILSHHEITKLKTGSVVRLSRSVVKRQDAITRVFFDADDLISLNKAYRVLNEEYKSSTDRKDFSNMRSRSDRRELASIKWTKSAINLHNNHVGRQIVREATLRQCKCHGLSGACQFQTCWDKLTEFDVIASKIRQLYLRKSYLVGVKSSNSFEESDLLLERLSPTRRNSVSKNGSPNGSPGEEIYESSRINPNELVYLYDSPDYCDDQPSIGHKGTKDRQCSISTSLVGIKSSKLVPESAINNSSSIEDIPGSCGYLCCTRGYYTKLTLHAVKCGCKFKFCCDVECADCLRQQMQHYCL